MVVALFAKGYYLTRAQVKIDKITGLDEPQEIKFSLLQKAGGVSRPAAAIGVAIYSSAIGLVVWAAMSSA